MKPIATFPGKPGQVLYYDNLEGGEMLLFAMNIEIGNLPGLIASLQKLQDALEPKSWVKPATPAKVMSFPQAAPPVPHPDLQPGETLLQDGPTEHVPDPNDLSSYVIPKPKKGKGVINLKGVARKPWKRGGKTYGDTVDENMNADILPGQWVRIYGISDLRSRYERDANGKGKSIQYREVYDRTFKLGDTCIYGSYNLIYTGSIVSIGAKTVTIDPGKGSGKKTQLDLHSFIWRNWDYNAERIANENYDTLMHI